MSISNKFYDKSLGSALSAIEIYNKPNFSQRSEVFSILIVNAWEALLKAKIILDNDNEIESIYIPNKDGTGYKTTRSGKPLTMELIGCANQLSLPEIVINNLKSLIEVRDASIHFINEESTDYLMFTLGVAAIKNYHFLAKEWFGDGLDKYIFYILPIGFVYNFKTIKSLDLNKEPEFVKSILSDITKMQTEVNTSPFHFACELNVVLKSAKKITEGDSVEVIVNKDSYAATTIIRDRVIVDSYPLTATELYKNVKARLPHIKRNDFFRYLKERGLRDDSKYSAYLFRNKRQKESYEKDGTLPNGISSLYNQECLRFVINDLQQKE